MDTNSKTDSLCDFCLSSKSKYSCSRCHRRYCSADCFKSVKHMQCSEEFFKKCVTEELLSQQFDESSKKKILEILKKNNRQLLEDSLPEEGNEEEEEEDEAQYVQGLDSRFQDLDLNDSAFEQLWNKLSDSEKQEFKQLIKSGKIGEFIELWNPWWKSSIDGSVNSLIKPIDESCAAQSSQVTNEGSKVPDLVTNIHKLNELISKPISPSVCPAVVNTLLSYCYVCRLFNGEYDSIEAIQTFVSKCPQISDNIICDDLSKSLEMCVQQIVVEQPSQIAIEALHDLKCLIEGPKLRAQSLETPEYALRALSDLISILSKIKKKSSKQKRNELKLELLAKKLDFFLSWSVANGSALTDCLPQINLIIETMSLSEESNRLDQTGDDLRTKLRPKTLIQEIN